jgi:hypothetical protein
MAGILDLASEPFAAIISCLDTRDWTGLWLCGDLRLCWRLGKGKAVLDLTIKWSEPSKSLWPSQIRQLDGLASFSFHNSSSDTYRRFTGLHLTTVSQNLEKLELKCDDALYALNELHSIKGPHFLQLQTLDINFTSSYDGIGIEFKLPSTLTSLKFFDSLQNHSLSLSVLPPYLVHLSINVKSLVIDQIRFPETLKSLELSNDKNLWTTCLSVVFQHLPRTIERVMVSSRINKLASVDWDAISGLTCLKHLVLWVGGALDSMEAHLVPRSVEVLVLEGLSTVDDEKCSQMLKALPQGLKRVTGIWPVQIRVKVAQSMPRTLESAEYRSVDPEAVSYLPNSFTRLAVDVAKFGASISSFPSSLLHLTLHELPCSLAAILPPGLQNLSILDTEFVLTGEIAERLPSNLKILNVSRSYNPVSDLERVFKALPRSLTSLEAFHSNEKETFLLKKDHLDPIPAPSHSASYLPRGLKNLAIECLDFGRDSMTEWIHGLPSLTFLKISICHLQMGAFIAFGSLSSLETLTLYVQNSPEKGWAQHLNFHYLPRSLSSLHIRDIEGHFNDSDISNDTLKGAPQLLILRIPQSPLVNEDCLVHLPNLATLRFGNQSAGPRWFGLTK